MKLTDAIHSSIFEPAIEEFQSLLKKLSSISTQSMTHGEIESLIKRDGMEVLRQLLQGYFDARALKEEKAVSIKGADGIMRTHRRSSCSRKLMTLFGEVTLHRLGYSARHHSSVYPMDEALNLPQDKYSHGLREAVMYEASQHSFDVSVSNIDRTTGGHIGKRQIERLTVDLSQYFASFYEKNLANEPHKKADSYNNDLPLLVMSMDAKGIVMHQDDLRKATKKAATDNQHKLKTRLSRGEKRNRKRMATVAAIYDVPRYLRSAEEIMGEADRANKRPNIKNKRVWASVSREASVVTEELFAEASARLADSDRACVILVDGDNHQLNRIKEEMVRSKIKGTVIVDFIHVLEYLWKAAYVFHSEGSKEAEAWVQHRAIRILSGNASHVAAGMRRSATRRCLSKEERKAVDTCARYILDRKNELRYNEYLAKGFPIATGVIEGACRHLINDRMDITGARWRLEGAEAILKLRSIQSSGDMPAYFQHYKEQSRIQNYRKNNAANSDDFKMNQAA